jgi:hypothetical protein
MTFAAASTFYCSPRSRGLFRLPSRNLPMSGSVEKSREIYLAIEINPLVTLNCRIFIFRDNNHAQRRNERIVRPLQDGDCKFTHFRVYLDNAVLILNAAFEDLEKVKYVNKRPSDFRLFKNKFAFVRNTQKLR